MALEPGTQIERFRVVRQIAQGGMAEVYRADQALTGGISRPVALKVIRPEYSESPDFREMFLDEARTACTLSHPNIVHIYEVGESGGLLYMAMELVQGETLASVARRLRETDRRLSDEALLAVGISTCSALEAVHALQIPGEGHVRLVHRDVSPHNLLLGPNGSLKLIDFGIAKAATNKNLTSAGVTKGKAGYFSPEQAMGKALDGRSDLFSLGVTLYKLASGGTPFDEHPNHQTRNLALVKGQWKPLESVCPGLPVGFYALVAQATRVNPAERYPDARAMREALEQVARESGIHVGTSSLAGYVAEEGSGSAPALRPGLVAPPRTRTEPLGKAGVTRDGSAQRPPVGLYVGVGLGAFVLAALSVVSAKVWLKPAGAPPAAAPVVQTAPVVQAAPVVPAVPLATPPLPAPPESTAVKPPRPPAHRPKPGHLASAERTAPPPPEPQVPEGQGHLRVGAVPDGEVSVRGARWGVTPLNRELPSGTYLVEIRSLDGSQTGKCKVTVWPDKTARVRYQFNQARCNVDN